MDFVSQKIAMIFYVVSDTHQEIVMTLGFVEDGGQEFTPSFGFVDNIQREKNGMNSGSCEQTWPTWK
jgi:hypothetical protein